MKSTFSRLIAILLLVIPGLLAAYGFLVMKDAFFAKFDVYAADPGIMWGKMILGFILFAIGVAFIGGWIFFRDRKRNYVAQKYRAKRKKG